MYYYLSKKNINFHLLSGDKFKWFTFINNENPIKNIKFLFNFDTNTIEYVLSNAYSNDVIKTKDKIYSLPINYFPVLTFDHDNNNYINLLNAFFINKSFDKFSNKDANAIQLINDEYYQILSNIYIYVKQECNEFVVIFEFLEKHSKNEIFTLDTFSGNLNFFGIPFSIILSV